jgi:aryl-alcohol dehydrogenase-like predicted oxidoreductase
MHARVRLGHSSIEVVPLGVGCWAWGDQRFWRFGQDHGPQDVVGAFEACVEAGLDFYDTAEVYGSGKSEQMLGALVRRSPRPLVVATKYAPLSGRGGPAAIRSALAKSLKRLGLLRVDLYQIHWPDRDEAPIAPTMDALAECVRGGEIGAVGVSNFSAAEMRAAHPRSTGTAFHWRAIRCVTRPRPQSGGRRRARRLPRARRDTAGLQPLEQGLLTGQALRDDSGWTARRDRVVLRQSVAAAQSVIAILRALAQAHGATIAAVAIAWLLAKPQVVPIPGAKTRQQAEQNARALDIVLNEAEIAQLDAASAAWRVAR